MSKPAVFVLLIGAMAIVGFAAVRALNQAFPMPIDPDHFPG
jgi:hypothetical protein